MPGRPCWCEVALAPPSCVLWWAVFVYISPVGVGCRVVGIEGMSFSFLYLMFFELYLVSICMVSGVGV